MSKKNRQLVLSVTNDDIEWQFFRAGGKGGQAQNKTSSGARCIHADSGARGESREERSQLQNRRAAFRRMVESSAFQAWLRKETGALAGREAFLRDRATWADRLQVSPVVDIPEDDVKIEVRIGGRWVEVRDGSGVELDG